MSMIVKICGLSTPASVAAARGAGASHLGFIFYPRSPRDVSPEQAGTLAAERGEAKAVAVTVDADDAALDAIVAAMRPDTLQLHGAETPARVAEVKARYGLPVIKAMAVRDAADLERARAFDGVADVLLLDAKPPPRADRGADLPGGNGVSFDWSLLDEFCAATPVWLSGGISRANLPAALAALRRDGSPLRGLDVSSGVESAPGVKDEAEIAAFLSACHESSP